MKLEHDELMVRTFVTDNVGNVFSVPIGPEFNEYFKRNEPPPGFEMVVGGVHVTPRYHNLVSQALVLYQVSQAAKALIEEHLKVLDDAGNVALSIEFERMAANLDLAQRAAVEGPSLLSTPEAK